VSAALHILRAGPLATVQDLGRFGHLRHGIGASGPMDRGAFLRAGAELGRGGTAGLEFSQAGLAFRLEGADLPVAVAGGRFSFAINGAPAAWNAAHRLAAGDRVDIAPGPAGNYGYLRLGSEIAVPLLLGSRATNSTVGFGGFGGRPLQAGDVLPLDPAGAVPLPPAPAPPASDGPIRFLWGPHAELFAPELRHHFLRAAFAISRQLDRMGVRLADGEGVFAGGTPLSLVSDAVVAGDIQILGDGTPIVLMRDHQPTGGYPRIGTLLSSELERFAQLRPTSSVRFVPVSPAHARALYLEASRSP